MNNLKNNKKKERFIKWHKMSYSESDRKYLKNENFRVIAGDRNKFNSATFKNINNSEKEIIKNFTPVKVKQCSTDIMLKTYNPKKLQFSATSNSGFFHQNSNNDKLNISALGLNSESTDINKNTAEKGLRSYYNKEKAHFIQRVLKGPPDTFRWLSWLIVSGVAFTRCSEIYNGYLDMDLEPETDTQINKDITRTLRDADLNSPEIQGMLYRVLKVLALVDKDLSYCQGMNFISGFLLIASDFDELETLYLLLAVFSHNTNSQFGLRNLFIHGFPLLMFFLYAFDIYFFKKLPHLYEHFNNIEIPTECWVSKWFQTAFAHILNFESVLRLWDHLLVHGFYFAIPFTLSLLKFLEKQLLTLNDLVEVTEFFKRLNTNQYKIDPQLQLEYNIETLLKDANLKYFISKEEIHNLLMNDYYKQKNKNCLLAYENKNNENNKFTDVLPYIISEKKYVIKNFSDISRTNSIHTESPMKKPINKFDASSRGNNKNTTAFTVNKQSTGTDKMSEIEKADINIEEDVITTELNNFAENRQILEMMHNHNNTIKFDNPFIKRKKDDGKK